MQSLSAVLRKVVRLHALSLGGQTPTSRGTLNKNDAVKGASGVEVDPDGHVI